MTLYMIRATGNDGHAGTAPGTAWLTVDHAANTVAAGDIVWICGGTYRETVTIDPSGTLGSEIEWYGDVDGAITGDAGLVVITALDANSGGTGTGSILDLNGKKWNEFYNLIFTGSGTGSGDDIVAGVTGNNNYEGILFDTCFFDDVSDSGNYSLVINYNIPDAITGNKPKCVNCVFNGLVEIAYLAMAAGDVACGWGFENCFFLRVVTFDGPAASTDGITGYELINCTGLAETLVIASDQWNTGDTGEIRNCCIAGAGVLQSIVADGGTWTTSDSQHKTEIAYTGSTALSLNLLGFMVEPILRKVFGTTPYGALEPIWDHNGGGFKSPAIDAGNATYAPATDLYGNPRPMGRVSDDIGAVESRRRIAQETTTTRTGANAGVFEGAGYHDIILPVAAALTVVTVYGRYDSNYTGDNPIIRALDIPGVADQFDDMAGPPDNWEQISCSFTPTAAGTVRIRLESRDTSATGKAFFDDMAVA